MAPNTAPGSQCSNTGTDVLVCTEFWVRCGCALPALQPLQGWSELRTDHTSWEQHQQQAGVPGLDVALCAAVLQGSFSLISLACRCDQAPSGHDGLCAQSRVLFASSEHPLCSLWRINTNLYNQVPCCELPLYAPCQLPGRNITSLHRNVSIHGSVISWCSRSLYLVLICTTACICALQKDASRIHFLSHITWKVFLKG